MGHTTSALVNNYVLHREIQLDNFLVNCSIRIGRTSLRLFGTLDLGDGTSCSPPTSEAAPANLTAIATIRLWPCGPSVRPSVRLLLPPRLVMLLLRRPLTPSLSRSPRFSLSSSSTSLRLRAAAAATSERIAASEFVNGARLLALHSPSLPQVPTASTTGSSLGCTSEGEQGSEHFMRNSSHPNWWRAVKAIEWQINSCTELPSALTKSVA